MGLKGRQIHLLPVEQIHCLVLGPCLSMRQHMAGRSLVPVLPGTPAHLHSLMQGQSARCTPYARRHSRTHAYTGDHTGRAPRQCLTCCVCPHLPAVNVAIWAAQYIARLLIKLPPKGAVLFFLFVFFLVNVVPA